MKAGHQIKLLKDLCSNYKNDIVDGPFGSNLKRKDYLDNGIPVLKIQNIKAFNIVLKKMDYVSATKYEELKRHSYKTGDIIMTKLGLPLGVSAIVKDIDDGLIVADLVRIRTDKIDTKYLCYHLNSPETNDFINKQQKGTTRPRVRITVVRDLPIYTPPIPEQQRIVGILDKAFASIATATTHAEQNLRNARELFDSTLNIIFTEKGKGWEDKRLGDLTVVQSGGTPLRSKTEYWGGEFAWYSSGELNHLTTCTPQRTITLEGLNNSNAKLFPKGSLLIGMYDTAALKMSIIDRDAAFNQAISGLKPAVDVDLVFILHAVNAIKPELLNLRRGVRQKNLSLGKIKNIVISIPNINKQQEVVSQLEVLVTETKRLEAIYQQKLTALAELKQSLLQQAFAGKL